MPRRVPGHVENLEAGYLVALVHPPGHWMGWAGERLADQRVDRVLRLALHDAAVLDRVGVALAAPQRQAELLAHVVAGALMVGGGVSEGVRGHGATVQLAEDPLGGVAGRGGDAPAAPQGDGVHGRS